MAKKQDYPFPFIATVTDCRHSLYGKRVVVKAASGTLRLVQTPNRKSSVLISRIHLRYEEAA